MRARTDLLVLGLALVLSVAGAVARAGLPLDVRNDAMKSRAGPAAAAQAARDAAFRPDDAVIVMLEPRGRGVTGAPDDPEVAGWLAALRALPELTRVQVLPLSGSEATLVALRVARGDAGLDEALDRVRGLTPPTHRLSITGQPVGEHAIARALAAEQARVVPVILAALGLLLLAVYRRPALAAAALLPGLGAILWLGGLQRLLGLAVDPVTSLLAPVVLTVGVAGTVHVLEAFLAERRRGRAPTAASRAAISGLARPLALTSLTTAAGFLALCTSSLPAVARFGALAALGATLTLVWILGVVPSWLRLTARGAAARAARVEPDRALARVWVARLVPGAPLIVGATLVAALFLGWRGAHATTDTVPERALPIDHPFRVETARVQARLGGDEVLELFLPAPQPALTPLRAAELVTRVASEDGVATPAGAPRTGAGGALLVSFLLRPAGSAAREALFARAEEAARALGFGAAVATGPAVQVARDSQALVRDQRKSLAVMLALLFLAMAAGLRSWRLALLGLVPNVVPCVVLYGGLELAGRPLSVATAMIATVLLGLIVDNTIHLLFRFGEERARGRSRAGAVAGALARCGRAVSITGGVLALGFAAGVAGRLATTTEFSGLAAATILLALVCDLVLLPAILLLRRRQPAAPALAPPQGVAPCLETTT